jgi:hypothetical protein
VRKLLLVVAVLGFVAFLWPRWEGQQDASSSSLSFTLGAWWPWLTYERHDRKTVIEEKNVAGQKVQSYDLEQSSSTRGELTGSAFFLLLALAALSARAKLARPQRPSP